MRKYYCDKCGKELTNSELKFSLDMIGKELCSVHAHENISRYRNHIWSWKFDDSKGFQV